MRRALCPPSFAFAVAFWLASAAMAPADETTPSSKAGGAVDFARDIYPIFVSRCIDCHGAGMQEGQLRLDARAAVARGGVSGPPVVGGKADESLLYRRIAGLGGLDRMPLDEEPLSDAQIALIQRWIDDGGAWPDGVGKNVAIATHWAYKRPSRPPLHKVAQKDWPQNAIDHFVLARLEAEGLKPSPRAEKARLLRRVHLDLVGLPPPVEEIDAFLNDPGADAYEKVVDRLLASRRYGEKWARPWLDAARYADSNGYQADQYREVWPYRDWVIDAMNADMPFDQFTLEQIAGDLLPRATVRQMVATGFHRQTTCNVEAGVDPEENRVNQIIDRVNTTGMVWLGTTLECAQCHSHPYDPFSQRDYYRLFAFFNHTPIEVKHTSATTYDFFGPKMDVPLEGSATPEERQLKDRFESARRAFDEKMEELIANQDAWEKTILDQGAGQQAGDASSESAWRVVEVVEFTSSGGASHKVLEDGSVLIGGARPDKDTYTLVAKSDVAKITAFRLEAMTDPSLPGNGPGRHDPERPNFVLHEFEVKASPWSGESAAEPVKLHSAWADYSQPQYDVRGAIDGDPKTGWAIHSEFHKPHVATFRASRPAGYAGGTRLHIAMPQNHGGTRTLGRLRISVCEGEPPAAESPPAERLPQRIVEIIQTPAASRDEELIDTLREYYLSRQPDLMALGSEVDALKKQLGAGATATTLVMVELGDRRETRLFRRGDFLSPADKVSAGTPAVLHPLPTGKGTEPNRLALARWLASEANPLTARVQVNRWWEEIFGRGIVRTVEDFGTQGEPPTHPHLLDWLAVELMQPEAGSPSAAGEAAPRPWSMKHIHKLIVMSATYQQDSRLSPALFQRDPHNELLARGPRVRLPAETIRDNALAVSGLLSAKVGGPPVYPPQPGGIWRHVGRNAPKYETDTDEDRYRRGIYVVWRRSAPYASFVNFDAPDRAACVVSRSRTNTPLQALTLLNDEAYVEMSWALAGRIAAQGGETAAKTTSDRHRVDWAWRTTLGRAPSESEASYLLRLYETERGRFEADSAAANALVGKNPLPQGVTRAELAAWFYVANILLNLDETITKG
jgi:hypothetical protein